MSEKAQGLRADLEKDPGQVASMFDQVSTRYDFMNTLMTGGLDHVWLAALRHAVKPQAGERILDLAAGTGASSAVLARSGATVVACDLSEGMLAEGRLRHPDIDFVQGDATALTDMDDDAFDAVTISYGLRNVGNTERALREMLRVVKPGGRVVVCEFSTPPNQFFRWIYGIHMNKVMPLLAACASSDSAAYDYLVESIRAWYPQEELARLMQACGWHSVEYRNLTCGVVALHRAYKKL